MPEAGIKNKKRHKDILTFEEIVTIVKEAADLGINKVRITGGEPLVKKDIIRLVEAIAKIKAIDDVAMTTNGLLLKGMALDLKNAGLNRVNISIDSLKPNRYKEITRGGNLNDVLDGIQEIQRLKITPLKLNTVVIGGFNEDEIQDFANLTLTHNLDVRFIELMPVGEASRWTKERFISNAEVKSRIDNLSPVYDDANGPADYYSLPAAKGRIGFISPISSCFCSTCNRIRLTSDGKIKPCLHSNQEIDIKKIVKGNPERIKEAIKFAIQAKPEKHYLFTSNHQLGHRSMWQIGG